MADFQPSETSTTVAAPIEVSSLRGSGGERTEQSAKDDGGGKVDAQRPEHDVSNASGGNTVHGTDMDATAAHNSAPDAAGETQASIQLQPPPPPSSSETVTTTAQPQPQQSAPPLKRFTSVNINKRFLEKTSSSGASSSGSPLASHVSGVVGGSGQRRGASPASRSPSTDRPATSRLVTAKLTAVPQPSTASTSGWLRTNTSTPGTSAAPTPPSSSPQPIVNGSAAPLSGPSASAQQSKRRPGEPSQNGVTTSTTSSSSQKSGSKPVWGKIAPSQPSAPMGITRDKDVDKKMDDFPTAAEAAHGRKTKALNAQIAAETAAAQTAAQKQAMNETAAAFRGAHLDPNAHHWDEMEDEDSDFLAGVIEFGDGTQYKIEHKAESAPPQEPASSPPPQDTSNAPSLNAPSGLHSRVSKEERFGEDFDRSWPRARTSPTRPTLVSSVPSRMPPPHGGPHHSPIDGSASGSAHSPHDGTSPTSRVLFNERSNRLEPWSNSKPRPGSGQSSGPAPRRDSREDHPPFASRQQAPGRDAPPHSHPSPSNVQLLQKAGAESAWKGGPPRGFSHAPDRGRWGAPLPRDDERPLDGRRRESMSSSDAPGTSMREASRDREGRRSRWDVGAVEQDRERRNSNISMPPPMLPPSLTRDRSRDAGRQLPPHLSRMPAPPVPPLRGPETRPHVSVPHSRPAAQSPSVSVRSLLSPTSEQAPSITGTEEGVDKDSLVKDAMQLAIERAKRRKQEGEEEEKRRLEAAERARKKAEALALTQEEKNKSQTLQSVSKQNKDPEKPPEQGATQATPPKINGVPLAVNSREIVTAGISRSPQAETPKVVFGRAPPPRTVDLAPGLPRRPAIPSALTLLTPASQADSWRSKAAPVPLSPPRPPSSPPPPPSSQGAFPPTIESLELDLSLQSDENIEVVDFCDLGKFMGHPPSPEPSSVALERTTPAGSAPLSIRARRPVASDFFDDRPSTETLPPSKSDTASWRKPVVKSMVGSEPRAPAEELGTQTMPIFLSDEPFAIKDTAPTTETKSFSTSSSSPPLNRRPSQSDSTPSNAAIQSVYVPPSVLALRSPRTASHFKEAPMSTLTDTMSRIKGALDGMQTQDPPPAFQLKELKENQTLEQRTQSSPPSIKPGAIGTPTTLWREARDARAEVSLQIPKILASPASHSAREVFETTRSDPPRSPKPAWNAFIVRLPKYSQPRDAISRKQLHFWNLPHPGVRWDILSWEPPVEGMNKRELSRDEIFHRKFAVKGGRLRVMLPNKRLVHRLFSGSPQGTPDSQPVLVTTAGLKIKLPSNVPSPKERPVISHRAISYDRPRDSNVPSWRKSAMPLTQPKKDYQNPPVMNGSPPRHELSTTSRSPPPEPSTPVPRLALTKNRILTESKPVSEHPATVSLPSNSASSQPRNIAMRSSGAGVAFFRPLPEESEADSSKPLPRFTVTSELDRLGDSTSSIDYKSADKKATASTINSIRGSPRNVSTTEVSVPGLVSSHAESKNSDESASGTRPVTPPSTHTSSAWGKSPLSFSLKESPARTAPDPEHLKAVWSQPSGRTTATTSNSLKGIADDLPSIPFTVQDMKSEDGETPPPTAPAPPPSRLSLQEVTRAFQQVPGAPPVASQSSRPSSYAPTPLLPSSAQQAYRSNQGVTMSLPLQHGLRPVFAPYPHSMVGHSPSPTLMYAPGMSSPGTHHRMPANGPSPPVAHPIWLPTPPPQSTQATAFMRAGPPPPAPMLYPSPIPGTSTGAPDHMMHRRMSVVSPPGGVPSGPNMYHPMDMHGYVHQTHQSPHHTHTHPVGHPNMHPMLSPPQHSQAPAMYAVPLGAGRGGIVPRTGYESLQQVPHLPPHNPGYQTVPPTSFSHPFHS